MIDLINATIIAYFTNASCTIASLIRTHPLDFNLRIKGKRLLGDGKTIEGTLIGINTGLIISLILKAPYGLAVTLASITGDLIGSFIKRRIGLKTGKEFLLIDQLGFITCAYIALSFYTKLENYLVLILLALTFLIHKLTNKIAFKIGLKKVPW